MSDLLSHLIQKILSSLNKIEQHDDLKHTMKVFYDGILERKNNEYYMIHMLDRVKHVHDMFDISDLLENDDWKTYLQDISKLLLILEHTILKNQSIIDAHGNKMQTPEMESKRIVNEYYLKQELCYGKQLKIIQIIPLMYNARKDTMNKIILYNDLVNIDRDDYYDCSMNQKYVFPVIIIGTLDNGEEIEFKTPMKIWGKLIELISRIISYEEKKSKAILPINVFIDIDNKWIEQIRNMTLLIKKKIKTAEKLTVRDLQQRITNDKRNK
jgi:hypothetical protein